MNEGSEDNKQHKETLMNNKLWMKNYPKGVSANLEEPYSSLNQVFEEAIHRYNDKVAFMNMGVSLKYSDLEEKATAFAAFLQQELGLKKGDKLAIQLPNLLQFPIALYGAFKAGLIVINTNPLYTSKEMLYQYQDAQPKSILILANFAYQLQEILPQTTLQSVIITEVGDLFPFPMNYVVNSAVKYLKKMVPHYRIPQSYSFKQALLLGAKKKLIPPIIHVDDIAFLQYTGGTTGVSKGAMLSHRNVLANMLQICAWMKNGLNEGEEVVITALPLYHIFSLTVNCLSFMRYGGTNVLITNPKDFPAFLRTLKTTSFTVMTGVNTLYKVLLEHPDFDSINLTKAKVFVAGAMALQTSVAEAWKKRTGHAIFEGYGLTEASPVVCCNPIDGGEIIGTIGMPLPGTNIKIVDENEKELPVGEQGELLVQGPQVMKGYWNRPQETLDVLKDSWLKTGDICVLLDNGYLKVVDRKKDMIIVSGFNVYPNEVEDVIATHPGVLEVAVVAISNESSGEIVKAFIVKKDPHLTSDEIIQHAKKELTNYKVPKSIEFRSELPKTNVGKILRRALRESKPH